MEASMFGKFKDDSKMNEDSDSSDDLSEDSDDEQEDEAVLHSKLIAIKEKIATNPYHYDSHVELINLARQTGELDCLRDARENMSRLFPLTSELWLDWLTDEMKLAEADEERERVKILFERAVQDYISVPLWLEYAQFSIGDMGKKDGMEKVREVFEQSLTAAGIHVTQGALLWEAYREFELAILTTLQSSSDSTMSAEQEEMLTQQKNRVMNLFKRQLSVPLIDMERTFEELREWSEGQFDSTIQQTYQKTLKKFEKLQRYEDALLSSEAPHLEEYKKYIAYEQKEGEPTRIQCIYERAVVDNCLVPDIWQKYTTFLDRKLKIDTVSLPVHERALRNCPWNSSLWSDYLRALEQYNQPHEKIKEVFEQALASGWSQVADFRLMWVAYLDYLRRRVKWEKGDSKEIEELRNTFQKALDHLEQIKSTPECLDLGVDESIPILKYFAKVEAKFCNNITQAREIWNNIMNKGNASIAQMWLEYANLERVYGDEKHLRRVLTRGIHSASDYPELVVEALLTFEREEGTLESLILSSEKSDAQMDRVREITEKKEEALRRQEEAKKGERKYGRQEKKYTRQVEIKDPKGQKRKWQANDSRTTEKKAKVDSEGFKIPPLPVMNRREGVVVEETTMTITPVVPNTSQDVVSKSEGSSQSVVIKHDSSKDHRTVFLSNVAYHVEEGRLKEIFSQFGEIAQIRLVKNSKGRSKGYCYVEYTTEGAAHEALANDRMPVEGRPVFVSPCEDKKNKNEMGPKFKFSTNLEKNKLFIKNLPSSTTEQDLKEMFEKHGKLKQIRLVTYRNGHSKGLAYAEFQDQTSASTALLKTDGTLVGDQTISVAYSNPPQRKNRGEEPTSHLAHALGVGSKDTGPRGRGRLQLSFLPRAVQRPPPESEERGEMQNGVKNGTCSSEKHMTNDDFRNMLLK